MNERVIERLRDAITGSLQYYANECREDAEEETATMLESLALRITNGIATEEDWLEAIDQIDVSNSF